MNPFKPRSKRPLTSDDKAIWQRVARTVAPSPHRARKRGDMTPTILPQDKGPFMRITPQSSYQKPKTAQPLEPSGDKRVRRGRVQINRRIDLHDLTRDQARPALFSLVRSAYAKDEKCLLIITGKGLRLNGVLRQNFPNWINAPEIRPLIASYAQAHIRHGGSGAWYVFLKRKDLG